MTPHEAFATWVAAKAEEDRLVTEDRVWTVREAAGRFRVVDYEPLQSAVLAAALARRKVMATYRATGSPAAARLFWDLTGGVDGLLEPGDRAIPATEIEHVIDALFSDPVAP